MRRHGIRSEGEATIGTAFEVLGQAAMMDVAKGLIAFSESQQRMGKPAPEKP